MADGNGAMGIIWKIVFSALGAAGVLIAFFGTLVMTDLREGAKTSLTLSYQNNSKLGEIKTELDDHGRRLDRIETKLP